MSQVIRLFGDQQGDCTDLHSIRRGYGLTVLEAATALGISTSRLEKVEQGCADELQPDDVRRKYKLFVAAAGNSEGKNLIYKRLPLRVARDILGMTVKEIAEHYGYKESYWRRLEGNYRQIPTELLQRIEDEVQDRFSKICAS